jgi:cardiolipin synthase
MYADCQNAKKSIDIEQYIFTNDDLAKKFIGILKKKAKEGLKVRILCDMVGGIGFYLSPALQELEDVGAQVIFFHPIKLWRVNTFTSAYLRDHRKFLIVDSEIGYTGGVGFNENMKDWRDTQVRVTGIIVKNMEYVFERMWQNTKVEHFYPFMRPLFTTNSTAIMTNSPHRGQRFLYWEMIGMIREAKSYVYITTPYFIPDRRLLRVMRLAGKRGVDIRLLLPLEADVRIVSIAAHSYYKTLLRAGVKIFLYKGILHAKTMAVDDTWGTVGSTNLDNLSLAFNYEANISTSEQKFINDIKNHFIKDLDNSTELTLTDLKELPLSSRFLGWLIRPFHRFL